MSIGNFKETNENDESKEAQETPDNTEKPRNQILETPDDYADDFDSKLDDNESKENQENQSEDESSGEDKPQEGEEKQSLLDKMRNLFSRKESSDGETANDKEKPDSSETPEKSSREQFADSLKVNMSPDEVKAYNEEHGYSSEPTKRPEGGVERERGVSDDPRREDSYDDAESNTDPNDPENQ